MRGESSTMMIFRFHFTYPAFTQVLLQILLDAGFDDSQVRTGRDDADSQYFVELPADALVQQELKHIAQGLIQGCAITEYSLRPQEALLPAIGEGARTTTQQADTIYGEQPGGWVR